MAIMYPEHPLKGSRSNAERKVFYALKDLVPDDYVVLHSVPVYQKQDSEDRLLDGEVDFLIIHPDRGMMVIEVKGGGILKDAGTGEWYSISFDGATHRIKDPYEQSKRYCYSILKDLRNHPQTRQFHYPAGHAVWFPDLDLAGRDLGVSRQLRLMTLEARDLKRAEVAVPQLFNNCLGKKGTRVPKKDGVKALREYLAPSWRIVVQLSSLIQREKEEIVDATQSQYKVLSLLQRQGRALVCGPAGSGKTFLAIEKAKRLSEAHPEMRFLVVCFNIKLANYIGAALSDRPNVEAMHFHGLCAKFCKKAGIEIGQPDPTRSPDDYYLYELPEGLQEALSVVDDRYDGMIVDEGQDFDSTWWIPLTEVLRNPEESILYIFYDDNQLLYNRRLSFPISAPPFTLSENCRNTRLIHEHVMKYYRGDSTPTAVGPEGRLPIIRKLNSGEDEKHIVEEIVLKLTKEKVEPADIMILTPRKETYSKWKNGDSIAGCKIDWTGAVSAGRKVLRCSTIHSFKGLESPVIILTETNKIPNRSRNEMLYVATSRANSHLIVVQSG